LVLTAFLFSRQAQKTASAQDAGHHERLDGLFIGPGVGHQLLLADAGAFSFFAELHLPAA
jgi:hypothetical protein